MTHSNTTRMLDYWQAQRVGPGAPARAAIDPAAFAELIGQTFMIGGDESDAYPFRLAGAMVQDLHRAPLTGADFIRIWALADRPRLLPAIRTARNRRQSLILQAHGRSLRGAEANLEILLAPLTGPSGRVDRMLGLYQPTSPLVGMETQRIERLFLLDLAFAAEARAANAAPRLATVDGRRIA